MGPMLNISSKRYARSRNTLKIITIAHKDSLTANQSSKSSGPVLVLVTASLASCLHFILLF